MELIQLNTSGQTSDKGEKREERDEKELETIGRKPEWVFCNFNVITRSFSLNLGSCRSGQESRDGLFLLAFEHGKTIIVNEFLGLWSLASFSGLFVVEARRRFGVDGRVDEDRYDGLSGGSTRDLSLSELEALRLFSEGRVSLARRRRLAL